MKKTSVIEDDGQLFDVIGRIVAYIDTFRNEPVFTRTLSERRSRVVSPFLRDSDVLRNLAYVIAYARADASRVRKMLETQRYDAIWLDFDVGKVALLNPCDVIETHWDSTLSPIMNGAKAYFIVTAARVIQGMGGIVELFNDCEIPPHITRLEDIEAFWAGFEKLHKQMKEHRVPYLSSVTSLLHFLLEAGYDCVKPDVVVMRVAKALRMLEKETDSTRKQVVRRLQKYALHVGVRPSEVDMYFLIQGGQSDSKDWVSGRFTPEYDPAKFQTATPTSSDCI